MSEPDLIIIVPAFNEHDSLHRLKSEMDLFLSSAPMAVEVLFVDDGSTDDSLSVIREISNQDKRYSYISLPANMGLSAALKAGIDHSHSKWIGYMDADLQTSPSDFALFLPYLEDHELVTGYRHNRQDKFVKRMSSLIANSFRRSVLRDGVRDTGCPLKIIRRDIAVRIPFFKGMHRFIPALVQVLDGKVKEVPVNHYARLEGASKYHLSNRIIQPFLDTLAVYWIKKRIIKYGPVKEGRSA